MRNGENVGRQDFLLFPKSFLTFQITQILSSEPCLNQEINIILSLFIVTLTILWEAQ